MKTIKVIELLNKIANGEEVPKKLLYKYKRDDYYKENYLILNEIYNAYYTDDENSYPISALLADNLWNLNDEVEIIEESEQDIDIQAIEEVNHYNIYSVNRFKTEENINDELSKYSLKINELVQAVKQLDKNIKEK